MTVVGWGAGAQWFYTQRSMGEGGGGLVELPYASSDGLVGWLTALPEQTQSFLSDTGNVVLAKFESLYQPAYFVTKDFLSLAFVASPDAIYNPFSRIYRDEVQTLWQAPRRSFRECLIRYAWGTSLVEIGSNFGVKAWTPVSRSSKLVTGRRCLTGGSAPKP